MEYINQIISTTLDSFDFGFCVAVNIITYIVIKIMDELNGKKKVNTWTKRIILLISIIIVSTIYYVAGSDMKLLVNSSILAPVFWSWIGKPICNKLHIDYIKDLEDTDIDNE